MKIEIFSSIQDFIDDTMFLIVTELQLGFSADLLSIAKVSITLYIVVYGYMVLAGKIQTPLADLIWTLAKFAIILAFVTNGDAYLTETNSAIKGLKVFFNNGENGLNLLDSRLESVAILALEYWKRADGIVESIVAVFQIVGFIPLLLGFIACGAMLIYSDITLHLLLATAPIFIFCLMWGFLRDSFNRWMSAIISNCLIILFTNVIMQFAFEFAQKAANAVTENFISALVMYFIAGGLTIMSVKWGREFALSLGAVSVDAAISGRTHSASARIMSNKAREIFNKIRGNK